MLIDDQTLTNRLLQQDLQAFEAVYDRYSPPLYAYILRMVKGQVDANEILQETFLVAWSHAEALREAGSIQSWLCAVARQKCLDCLRAY